MKNINIHIKSGQTIGIIGGTGSAKSTFVQMIPRLYDVTGGSVKVGGIDVREYNLEALRDQVSMVLQKNVLFSGTIYENIRWETNMQPTKRYKEFVNWLRQTVSYRSSRINIIR